SLNFNGVDICACTLAGRSGTVVFPFSGTGDASGASGGRFTIKGATGALADLHGVGTFQSSNGGSSGSFSGDYNFDPYPHAHELCSGDLTAAVSCQRLGSFAVRRCGGATRSARFLIVPRTVTRVTHPFGRLRRTPPT